eukprot:3673608-Prymnesium_polylepis.3
MLGVSGAIAQLTSRAVVAFSAVAITLITGVPTSAAGAPAPVRLAAVQGGRGDRMTPKSLCDVERGYRAV